ncbi:putative flavoprotein YhiN [Geomicrobium halophilum]|uniref:Putative flavoprotein YhiN n=1 Tax=Geomicrobium halophilum TaxID=549000 RepID=A0A841PM54_9BACL|nr:putative flavoprotein YhiN [Geomicrobium halophilum]
MLLTGCGESAGVESLEPQEMEEYLEENEEAFVLTTQTEDEEEHQEAVNIVDENIDNISVKEINAQSEQMLDNDLLLEDVGIDGPSVFNSLSYYENGDLEERISVSEVDYDSEDALASEIQNFDHSFE